MAYLFTLLSLTLAGLMIAGVAEQRRHRTRLATIPVRILVNGIRGKSSITRLCAGALRGGGVRVVAKTTGSAARFIWTDGSEEAVYRRFGVPNVSEQIEAVRRATIDQPQALVIECMAIDPSLQELTQERLVRSTIGVISNVREDHLVEMGPTLADVARALSRTMPEGGICITAEREFLPVLQQEADRRSCRLIQVDPASVSDEEVDRFGYFTFKENVAIAMEVARQLGVPRVEALGGMIETRPDPGVLTVETYHVGTATIRLANIFAANDPRSTLMSVERLMDMGEIRPPIYVLINCRPDRIDRNRQMGALVPDLLASKVFVIGHPSRSAIESVPPTHRDLVTDLGGDRITPAAILGSIVAEVEEEATVLGIGNIHGQAELLLEHLEQLGALR